jgi:hypothetical protein
MSLLMEAMNGLGAVLLPLAAALLLEELTLGGLVRLLVAPWPGSRNGVPAAGKSPARARAERNNQQGEGSCSH